MTSTHISISHIRTLKNEEVKWLAQGHTVLFCLLSPHSIHYRGETAGLATWVVSLFYHRSDHKEWLHPSLSAPQLLFANGSRPVKPSTQPALTSPEVSHPREVHLKQISRTFHTTEEPALPSSSPARLLDVGLVCSHCISVIPASSWNRKHGKPFTWWESLPGKEGCLVSCVFKALSRRLACEKFCLARPIS